MCLFCKKAISIFLLSLLIFFLIPLSVNSLISGVHAASYSMSSSYNLRFDGEAAGDEFGYSVSSAGDVNHDGYDDVIIGAHNNDALGSLTGRAYLYYGGSSMNNTADLTFTGAAADDEFGTSVSSAGDVNHDGYDDVIIGALWNSAGANYGGSAYIYYGGSSMDNIADVQLKGTTASGLLGNSVASAGDVNHDGYDDVIVGAYGNNAKGAYTGRAYIYYGGSSMDSTADLTFTGEAAGDQFSYMVSSAGDVNRDGYDDVIIGAGDNDSGGSNAGRAYVFYGGSSMDNTADVTFTGEAASNYLGYAVSSAYDVNRDGYDDVLVSAWGNSDSKGKVYIYYGGSSMDNTADVTFTGEAAHDIFGYTLNFLGDINEDGYDDVIVGAYAVNSYTGRAYVFYGGSSMDSTADIILNGAETNSTFSKGISSAGDVNGDEREDLLIGAYSADIKGVDSGSSYLIYNYPHSISLSSHNIDQIYYSKPSSINGNVSALDSVMNIDGIQYNFDNDTFGSSYWENCEADDSDFGSKDEKFHCNEDFPDLKEGTHFAFLRSFDDNSLYTSQTKYKKLQIDIDSHIPYIQELILSKNNNNNSEYINKTYLDNSYFDGENLVYNIKDTKPKKLQEENKLYEVYSLGDKERLPKIVGEAHDRYFGGGTLNDHTFDSVSTSPYELTLSISKLNPKEKAILSSDTTTYGQYINNKGITVQGTYAPKLYPSPYVLSSPSTSNSILTSTLDSNSNIVDHDIISEDKDVNKPNTVSYKLRPPMDNSKYNPYQVIVYDLSSLYKRDLKIIKKEDNLTNFENKLNFALPLPSALEDGFYLVNIKLTDKAGNIFYYPSYYLGVNYKGSYSQTPQEEGNNGEVKGEETTKLNSKKQTKDSKSITTTNPLKDKTNIQGTSTKRDFRYLLVFPLSLLLSLPLFWWVKRKMEG